MVIEFRDVTIGREIGRGKGGRKREKWDREKDWGGERDTEKKLRITREN